MSPIFTPPRVSVSVGGRNAAPFTVGSEGPSFASVTFAARCGKLGCLVMAFVGFTCW